jgi:Transmembrane protein 231
VLHHTRAGHKRRATFQQLQDGVSLDMRGLAYVEHSSAVPGSELQVVGSLELNQRRTFRAGAKHSYYNTPVLFGVNQKDVFQLVRNVVNLCSKCRLLSFQTCGIMSCETVKSWLRGQYAQAVCRVQGRR